MAERKASGAIVPEQSERRAIKREIKLARQRDLLGEYVLDRNSSRYISHFFGLSATFDYVRSLPTAKIVDIGAGTTTGIYELSQFPSAHDIEFHATVLTPEKVKPGTLPQDKIHVTSAEELSGFDNESVGAFLALNSISYSKSPRMTVKRIDEALVKGGMVKAVFEKDAPKMRDHRDFVKELENKGYDVSSMTDLHGISCTILAIKPGGEKKVSAHKIITQDNYKEGDLHRERNQLMEDRNKQYVLFALSKYDGLTPSAIEALTRYGYALFRGRKDIDYSMSIKDEEGVTNAAVQRSGEAIWAATRNLYRERFTAESEGRLLSKEDIERMRMPFIKWAESYESLPGVVKHGLPCEDAADFREIALNLLLVIQLQRELVDVLWAKN